MPRRPARVIRSSDLDARKGGLLRFKAKREELDYIQSGFKDAERVAVQVRRQAQSLLNIADDLEAVAAEVSAILTLAASITELEDLVADVGPLGTVADGGNDGDLLATVGGVPAWIEGGSGSGIDADLLDGNHATAFALVAHAHDAEDIGFAPAGSISASDVQAAIAEIDAEKLPLSGGTLTGTVADPSGTLQAIPRSTTVALEAIGDAINTANKLAGKVVINTTVGTIVTANGAAAADVWLALDGTTAHTPV